MGVSGERVIRSLYAMNDLSCVTLAWVLAYYLRFYGPFEVYKGIPDWTHYLKLTPFILIIWLGVFRSFYTRNTSHSSALYEALAVARACFIALMIFIAVTYFYSEYHYSRLTLLLFAVMHPVFIVAGRSGLRKLLRIYKKRYRARKILVIGGGPNLERAFAIAASLDLASTEVVGIVGVASSEGALSELKQFAEAKECTYFDVPKDWVDFFNAHPCETVLLALANDSHEFLVRNLESIVEQVPDIKVLPDLSYLSPYNSGLDMVMNAPVISVHDSPLKGLGQLQKRVFDVLGSLFCILVFSPILFLVALLVKFSSPGRILYTQERMGVDGRIFPILKFRTMPENIESSSGAVWAQKEDGRTTQLGKWLRKTSLDELPQLFNVLIGHMSLVGPRPERPVFVSQFRRSVPGYMLRHKVKAGMTGWAQVQGWRGNTSIEKRIEADLHYIQNWSLTLDIKILLLTLVKGFVNSNAY